MRSSVTTRRDFVVSLLITVFVCLGGSTAIADEPGFDVEIEPLAEPVLLRYEPVDEVMKQTFLTLSISTPNSRKTSLFVEEAGSISQQNKMLLWNFDTWQPVSRPDDPKGHPSTITLITDDRGVSLIYASRDVDPETGATLEEFQTVTPEIIAQLITGYPVLPEHPISMGDELADDKSFPEFMTQFGALVGTLVEASQAKLDFVELPKNTAVGMAMINDRPCAIFELIGTLRLILDDREFDGAVSGYTAFDLETGLVLLSDLTLDAAAIDGSGNDFRFNALTKLTLE